MTVLVRVLPPEERSIAHQPRDDLVTEVAEADGRFTARGGPFREYERTLTSGPDGELTETIRYRPAPMVWSWMLGHPFRMALRRRPHPGHTPWWSPPEAPDHRGSTALGTLCYLALVFGFLGTLLTQTITFAADEFDASKADQSAVLSLVRIGVLGALVLTTLADRRGRRRVLLGCATVGCILAAVRRVARPRVARRRPDVRARDCHRRRRARRDRRRGGDAHGVAGVLLLAARGRGCLRCGPVPDGAPARRRRCGWVASRDGRRRLPAPGGVARRTAPPREPPLRRRPRRGGDGGARLSVLAPRGVGAAARALHRPGLAAAQRVPARDEQGFSAWQITIFTILTNTPGGIGLVIGGRLADTRGRRGVGAFGVAAGTLLTVAMVLLGGWPMWGLSMAAAIAGAMVVPAITVYGPELFPTSLRGRANGTIAILGVTGSVVGLLTAGWLSERWDGLGPALTLLSVGPLVMALLVLVAYPETAHRELEDINPEDRLDPPGAMPSNRGAPVD